MLEGPESPKSAHKLVLPENVAESIFSCVFLCERGSLNANLVMVTTKTQFQNTETALNSHLKLDSAKKSSFWAFQEPLSI